MKEFLKKAKRFFSKLYTRFLNYKNTKKWFVLYLAVLAFCLFLFPVVDANGNGVRFLFSKMLCISWFIMLLAMVGLFLWNLSVSARGWITKLCALREDEPLVDFVLWWMIVSVFLWALDWANIAMMSGVTQKVGLLNWQVIIDWLLLFWWLVWCCISLIKVSKKSDKRTKIVNIVEDHHQKVESQRSNQVTHLFDDLNNEN